jgi:hypothetical protein
VFFVAAFRTTGDQRWLSAARAGAQWMEAHLDEAVAGWSGCGLLDGTGGWAVVLHELAVAADDERASRQAHRVLNTIAGRATEADDGGVHWHDLTEICWGTAGVHRLGGDPQDLAFAVTLVDDILDRALADETGLRWPGRRSVDRPVAARSILDRLS